MPLDIPDRERLRLSFEEVPELYDRVRPTYPPALFDGLVELAGLREGGRVLEIGPGPGKATIPLAERGLEIVAVELGPQLASIARRNLAAFPKVEIVTAQFETWEPAAAGFDAAVSFTAFHWIDPAVRYEKTARLLRPDGALVIVETSHVLPDGGDPFWAEVQEDYAAIFPDEEVGRPPAPDDVEGMSREPEASGRFARAEVRRNVWDVIYTADEYIAVIDTYSSNRSLEPKRREHLYELLRRRIAARPVPEVRKSYLALMAVATRR